ncbi:MAG: DUF4430 domain-containing protein [Ruminococcus sp.]|nr:DUF4430 domain-containing protein [Ruminococcus sp.]
MEKKTNSKKLVISIVGIVVLIALCVVMWLVHDSAQKEPDENIKTITVQVKSERDSYSFEQEYTTDAKCFGDFLETADLIGFDDTEYGRYITSVQGMEANDEEQSWWSISVNGESAVTGVDEIVVEDGSVYLLELKIGW